jgi:hypothetical protein
VLLRANWTINSAKSHEWLTRKQEPIAMTNQIARKDRMTCQTFESSMAVLGARSECTTDSNYGESTMTNDEVVGNQQKILSNQDHILGNQGRIESNQTKLDKVISNQATIVANQERILVNQEKLDHVLSNQSSILANQEQRVVANQTKILGNQERILAAKR